MSIGGCSLFKSLGADGFVIKVHRNSALELKLCLKRLQVGVTIGTTRHFNTNFGPRRGIVPAIEEIGVEDVKRTK